MDTPDRMNPAGPKQRKFVRVLHRALALTIAAPVIIIALCLVAFGINSFLDHRAGRAFAKVKMGSSKLSVVELLGQPDRVRACGPNLWWGGDDDYRGKNDGRCVTEVRYEYFLSAWGVGYSADGRVVSKYHYFSE
jgi:hypothetical protein